jgi:YidC/Oxa1 family membrane protein insertase
MFLGDIFSQLFVRPIFNLVVGITNLMPGHEVAISIIIVTIVIRLLLLPPAIHHARQLQRNQEKMKQVKEKLTHIQQQHKNNQAKKAEETMRIYREAGINPASGCLPLLIQLPILFALYRVFLLGIGPETFHLLYSFVGQPHNPQLVFVGLQLANPSLLLAVIAGSAQFILMRLAGTAAAPAAQDDQAAQMMAGMQKNMLYIFPAMTVLIAAQVPAALGLYWVVSTLFGIGQHYFFKKYLHVTSFPTA